MLSLVVRRLAPTLLLSALLAASSVAHAQLENPLEDDDKIIEELPMRYSELRFGQTLAANSFVRDTQLSYNPSYSWLFALYLSWHFDPKTSVAFDQTMVLELTDSDITRERQRPLFLDTRLAFSRQLVKLKLSDVTGLALQGNADMFLPTSLSSQAADMYLGTRLGIASGLSLPKVLDGMSINLSFNYLHRFLGSNVVQTEVGNPCLLAGAMTSDICTQTGGSSSVTDSLRLGLSGQLAFTRKWGAYVSAFHVWNRGANLADASIPIDSGGSVEVTRGDRYHWRNSNILEVGVSYSVLKWLGLSAAVSNLFSELGPDGLVREPLHLAETYFGLNADFKLDRLYLMSTGQSR